MKTAPAETMEFTEAGKKFLDAFYEGTRTDKKDTAAKIEAIRRHIIKGEMLITSYEGVEPPESELRALEYFVLIQNGFEE